MERRKAFATAGAVSATALVGVLAVGANIGLFGLTSRTDGPGKFQIVDSTQVAPTTVPDDGEASPPATSASPTAPPSPAPAFAAPAVRASVPTTHPYEPESEPEHEEEDD